MTLCFLGHATSPTKKTEKKGETETVGTKKLQFITDKTNPLKKRMSTAYVRVPQSQGPVKKKKKKEKKKKERRDLKVLRISGAVQKDL